MTDTKTKLRVLWITLDGQTYVVDEYTAKHDLWAELSNAWASSEERTYMIRVGWMDADDYNAMPEFKGFL